MNAYRVEVDLDDVIGLNLEGFLDLISEKAGEPLLTDINYEVLGTTQDGMIVLKVTGDPHVEDQ